MTNTVEAFVTITTHEKDGKRFIRARFPIGAQEWRTAFNPDGISSVEWTKRVSRLTGDERIQTRWPVRVSFTESGTVGDDVVKSCRIAAREFVPVAIEAARAEDLAVIDAL